MAKDSNKAWVKLGDPGGSFHDMAGQQFIGGNAIKQFTKSTLVSKALKEGVLVEVDERDVPQEAKDAQAKAEANKQSPNMTAPAEAEEKAADGKDSKDGGDGADDKTGGKDTTAQKTAAKK